MHSPLLIILLVLLFSLLILWIWIERWHLILPSTIPALKWMGIKRILKGEIVNALLYGRWIPQYVKFLSTITPHLGPRGKAWLENGYHGKILTPDLAKSIITLNQDVPLQSLSERVIPYARARDIVLSAPLDIVISHCGCKTMRAKPCRKFSPPYETCILIGKPLTDYLLEHNPTTCRRISPEEALELLEKFHRSGLVSTGWFKDCIRDQFYVICNCCDCCCLGFESIRRGVRQLTSSGYVAKIDREKCRGCGQCQKSCPFKATQLKGEKSELIWEACMGCGVCVSNCPAGARALVLDEAKGLPLDVRNLTPP